MDGVRFGEWLGDAVLLTRGQRRQAFAALAGCGKWGRSGAFPSADSEKPTFTSMIPAILRVQRAFCPFDGGGCPRFRPPGRLRARSCRDRDQAPTGSDFST